MRPTRVPIGDASARWVSVEEPKSPVRTLSLCLGRVNDTSFFSGYRSHPSALQLTQPHDKPAGGLGLSQGFTIREHRGATERNTENPGLQVQVFVCASLQGIGPCSPLSEPATPPLYPAAAGAALFAVRKCLYSKGIIQMIQENPFYC